MPSSKLMPLEKAPARFKNALIEVIRLARQDPPILDTPIQLEEREINTTVRYGRYCGTQAEHDTERRKLAAFAVQCRKATMFVPKEVMVLREIVKKHNLHLIVRAHYDAATRASAHYLQLSVDPKVREQRLIDRLQQQLD